MAPAGGIGAPPGTCSSYICLYCFRKVVGYMFSKLPGSDFGVGVGGGAAAAKCIGLAGSLFPDYKV